MKRYLPSIKRYSWIILLCLGLMMVVGYFVSKLIPSTYSVNSILLVEPGAPGTTLPGVTARGTALDEATYYSGEIVSRAVMEYVYKNAPELKKYHYKPDDLLLDIVPATSTTVPTITITATVTDPNGAIAMANAVAVGFSKYISEQAQAELALEKSNLQTQVNNQMAEKNQDQATMQAVGNTRDIRYIIANNDLGLVNQRINALEQQLDQLPVSVVGDVFVQQKAEPIDVQTSSKNILIIAAGGGVGIVIGILILLLMVYLDERLYGEDRIKEKLEMSYLGGLARNKELKAHPKLAKGRVRQQLADIYVNLHLAGVLPAKRQDTQGAVLLVTSPQVAEGKTTVAAGLAATVARGGGTVAVIDGNMREPATHIAFGMQMSGPGLSGLLKSSGRETVDDIVQRSNVPGVWLLPVGTAMEDPAFLLEEKLPSILLELRKKVDLVIIDGPALLDGVEAGLMAKMVDGVALVIDYKQDKMKLLLRAKEILVLLAHVPAGVVMNRMPRRHSKSYFAAGYSEPAASEELMVEPATDEEQSGNEQQPELVIN